MVQQVNTQMTLAATLATVGLAFAKTAADTASTTATVAKEALSGAANATAKTIAGAGASTTATVVSSNVFSRAVNCATSWIGSPTYTSLGVAASVIALTAACVVQLRRAD